MRQITDVIQVRQEEERKRSLTYKEIEVRALMGAIHSAAGNAKGAEAAQQFAFHAAPPEPASSRKVGQFFKQTGEGLISDEELAAEVERLKAARA